MTRWELTLDVPLAAPLPSVANLREHWAVKAKRTKAQRERMAWALKLLGGSFLREWRVMAGNEAIRLAVTWTRVAPRELDDDNLRSAFKACRDELAEHVGINDRSRRYEWAYLQAKGAPAFRCRLEVLAGGDHDDAKP